MATLARIDEEARAVDEVVPYSMHVSCAISVQPVNSRLGCPLMLVQVSSKYLELTKRKLELTRLPREIELGEGRRWALGTPKSVLEGVLDYW
jgi:hypothetical protein